MAVFIEALLLPLFALMVALLSTAKVTGTSEITLLFLSLATTEIVTALAPFDSRTPELADTSKEATSA